MFPIEDLSGNIIAFGGRIMGDGEPKYLNSPESPVYTKGKNLYGLQKAKNSIRENDGVIIVEGYMDFLSLWGCGFTNVVAVLGTALTKDQVALIRRFTKNVFIVFDPDEAGKIAVERSMKLFLEEEMHAKVIILPEGYDPDDYVKKFGRDAFSNAITQAPSMIDYYIEKVLGGKATFEENMDSVRNSISFMRNISNPVQRNLFIKRVSEKLGVDQRQLKAEINKDLRESSYSKSGGFDTKKAVNVDAAELNLVYMMVEYPEKVAIAAEKKVLDYFIDPNLKKLGESIEKFFKDGEKDMSGLIADLPDDAVKDRLLKLMVSESPFDDVTIDRAFADTARSIKTKWYKNRHNVLKKELFDAQKTGDKELCGKLLIEKEQLLKEERGISNG
jgi:DNA primase